MTIMRRTRPTRPAVAQARRVVRTRQNFFGDVCEKLKLIANLEEQAEELARQRTEIEEEIEALMVAGKLQDVDDGVWSAAYKPSAGRASSEVDLTKFRKYVGDAKFFSVVKVGVTDAKTLVSEKEWVKAGITTVEGKAGPQKLSITRKKKK